MAFSRRSFLPLFLLSIAAFGLSGCLAVDESKAYLDIPLGSDYIPVATRRIDTWPVRVLVLPVSGQVSDQARAEFELQFLGQLKERLPWILFSYNGLSSTSPQLGITQDQALARAQQLNADSILYVELSYETIYSPLRIVADIVIQDVVSRGQIFKLRADYDARNKAVATSARRYAQQQLQSRDLPDRSLAILNDQNEFLRFAGFYSAQLVANAYIVPAQAAAKAAAKAAQKSDAENPNGFVPPPQPSPQFQEWQSNTDK